MNEEKIKKYMSYMVIELQTMCADTFLYNRNRPLTMLRFIDDLEDKINRCKRQLYNYSDMPLSKETEIDVYLNLEMVNDVQRILDDYCEAGAQ